MGAHNNLHHIERCENCENIYHVITQYKHGVKWAYNFIIGDKIELDGNHEDIETEGYSNECSRCGTQTNFNIVIRRGVLVSTKPRKLNLQ